MATTTSIGKLGWQANDFALEGIDGKTWRLSELRGKNGTLVMFICNHCPYVRAAINRVVRDATDLEAHAIRSIAVMPNDPVVSPGDSFENMKVFARQYKLPFPYVIDRTQDVARAWNAVCTPEFFGLDAGLVVRYHGRLDAGGKGDDPGARRELFGAMVEIGKTGRATSPQTPSMGCSIKWRSP
ncbi:MAG: thioredoxin family protein [Pseudomonadota bacterium]